MTKQLTLTEIEILSRDLHANLLADTKTHQHRMEIRSESSDRLYIVSRRVSDGKWLCGCPDFIFRRRQQSDCKHLRAMRDALSLIQQQVDVAALEGTKKRAK